jgi:hypothetical protein
MIRAELTEQLLPDLHRRSTELAATRKRLTSQQAADAAKLLTFPSGNTQQR